MTDENSFINFNADNRKCEVHYVNTSLISQFNKYFLK